MAVWKFRSVYFRNYELAYVLDFYQYSRCNLFGYITNYFVTKLHFIISRDVNCFAMFSLVYKFPIPFCFMLVFRSLISAFVIGILKVQYVNMLQVKLPFSS